jgi:hypothetical protein
MIPRESNGSLTARAIPAPGLWLAPALGAATGHGYRPSNEVIFSLRLDPDTTWRKPLTELGVDKISTLYKCEAHVRGQVVADD